MINVQLVETSFISGIDAVVTEEQSTAGEAYRLLFGRGFRLMNPRIVELSETRVQVRSAHNASQYLLTLDGTAEEMQAAVFAVMLNAECITYSNQADAARARMRTCNDQLWVRHCLYTDVKGIRTLNVLALAAAGIEAESGISRLKLDDILDAVSMAIDTGDFNTALDLLHEQAKDSVLS